MDLASPRPPASDQASSSASNGRQGLDLGHPHRPPRLLQPGHQMRLHGHGGKDTCPRPAGHGAAALRPSPHSATGEQTAQRSGHYGRWAQPGGPAPPGQLKTPVRGQLPIPSGCSGLTCPPCPGQRCPSLAQLTTVTRRRRRLTPAGPAAKSPSRRPGERLHARRRCGAPGSRSTGHRRPRQKHA